MYQKGEAMCQDITSCQNEQNPIASETTIRRVRLTVRGIVQGVGFRPFLHRLADAHAISGWARNTGEGLEGELEGRETDLSAFLLELRTSPPPMAEVENIITVPDISSSPISANKRVFSDFQILSSEITPFSTLISPDTALCPDCRKELFNPSDRRYRYPFINCTNCGSRYTIIRDLPYDRCRTAMEGFTMCNRCQNEFDDIKNRRYHAQPNACASCGPNAIYLAADGTPLQDDPFSLAQKALAEGSILAVRGTGGIHLACDARNRSAVKRLREKKHRLHKPFALMCRSLDTARELCHISEKEADLLCGRRRPIVLLSKKEPFPCPLASGISPRAGLMLPYTPFHELLMDGKFEGPDLIIMTSANRPGCPVLTENADALSALSGIADGFLLHDRPIANRCDDSLVTLWDGHPYFFRRSRGYTPAPLTSREDSTGIFALGAEQKASFALGKERYIFLSPHIGDLKNAETMEHYLTALQTYRHLFDLKPSVYVCDSHPDYLSSAEATAAADRDQVPLITVQHHWAHMVSCMEDNQLDGPVFGIVWDGTGLAPDHSVWGGEYLTGDARSYRRRGSIRRIRLIGGDRAAKEIGRVGFALLEDIGMSESGLLPYPPEERQRFRKLLDTPFTVNASSIGRLFDGVCSLLTKKMNVEYEGEGAVLLESLSPCEEPDFLQQSTSMESLSYPRTYYRDEDILCWDTRPVIQGICEDILDNQNARQTTLRFLVTLCCTARDQTVALNRDRLPVILSGGVFQNRFLLSGITQLLSNAGFEVYSHKRTSPNDEGLCLGQLAIARALSKNK